MVDKRSFCKRFAIWAAIVVAAVIAVLGLCFGKVVEGSLAVSRTKTVGLFDSSRDFGLPC